MLHMVIVATTYQIVVGHRYDVLDQPPPPVLLVYRYLCCIVQALKFIIMYLKQYVFFPTDISRLLVPPFMITTDLNIQVSQCCIDVVIMYVAI